MNYMSIGTVAVLAFGLLRGWFKGIVGEIATVISIALGVAGVALIMFLVGNALEEKFGAAIMAGMFLLLFIVFVQLVKVLLGLIKIFAKLPVLNGINRTFGMLIGIAEGLLLVWVAYIILEKYQLSNEQFKTFEMIADNKFTDLMFRYNPLRRMF